MERIDALTREEALDISFGLDRGLEDFDPDGVLSSGLTAFLRVLVVNERRHLLLQLLQEEMLQEITAEGGNWENDPEGTAQTVIDVVVDYLTRGIRASLREIYLWPGDSPDWATHSKAPRRGP